MATITNGTFQFPANFDVQFAGPIDRRLTVDDLVDLATLPFVYDGMLVSVVNDSTAANNGPYFYTGSQWTKLQIGVDPVLAQIIADDTSITVSDDNSAAGSTMAFVTNGQDSMTVNSIALILEQVQTLGSIASPIGSVYLDATKTINVGTAVFDLDANLNVSSATDISETFTVAPGILHSGATGTVDLGGSSNEFKDLYLAGDIILANGGNITVGGVPFGVPTLTLSADSNIAGDWDTYGTGTKVGTLNSTTLGSKDGGTIIVNNEENGSNPIAYLPFGIDTTSILDDTQKFLIAAKGYKQAAIILAEASTSIVYGTTTTAGDTVYVGNGQVLELWRQGGTNYYVIRSA